jgi:hypothetical protein
MIIILINKISSFTKSKLDIKEIEYEISKELEDYLVYINETYFNFKFERI